MTTNVAVIFAGGMGTRMNSHALPKQFLEIHGKPILVHTLEKFENHPDIDAIALATHPDWRAMTEKLLRRHEITKARWVVNGGETGQESRHKALRAVAADVDDPSDTLVLLHDGVRPLINDELISANIATATERGNAITCTKFNETVAVSSDDTISEVIPRDHIYAAQAPQTFHLDEILGLYDLAVAQGEHDSIDSCSLMEAHGRTLYRVEGPRSNIKITTAEDFYVCRTYFDVLETRQIAGL
ncbi:MAG: 2-C-methyl-D-erythritol 4-phosphate cytidylyltransferase [Tessaracoccus sp.]|uniref:IspD/TarI family cytidylyltransferase n=1 Tax=Tessaracoccus sp. TaxID=1971211 RepID=UPI001EB67879|nr:IspD/TarI family cytidylyltransferase [Tessaracoccus sp.]MBK7820151.1 2-C-methyl-D-erythritol 4-phosphate cytidylyltransferase [Tessaracoccus sp.]